nr:MAG TPA: hypothetical protein [Microviridae sp.]
MAFRNIHYSPPLEKPRVVLEDVLQTDIVDGLAVHTRITVKSFELASSLPKTDAYKLSDLLAAGVPLTPVNPVIFDNPATEASRVVANLPIEEPKE